MDAMTIDHGAAATRRVGGLVAGALVLAVLSALLGAVYQRDADEPDRAGALAVTACVAGALATWWWRTRRAAGPSTRAPATASATVSAALTVGAGVATWLLSDNLSGLPLLGIGIATAVLQFGIGVGVAVGALLVGIVAAAYASVGTSPVGGIVPNLIMTGLLVALAVLAAEVVAELQHARDLAEASTRSRRNEALAAMDRTLAAERMEHARTLHDDLGQRLTIIGVGLDIALRRPDDPEAWAEVGRARAEVADALGALRTLVRALSPLTTREAADIDLDAALDRLAGAFSGTGLDVELVRPTDAPSERLDPLAYRIIQEGLTNVVRHSDARRVTVTFDTRDGRRVSVADDGGASGRLEPGFGLTHLRSRVEAAGGTFRAGPTASGFMLEASYPQQAA